jgi:hypothetical protein
VTHKLKQLWIVYEATEDGAERTTAIEITMAVNDVAKEISHKLQKEMGHNKDGDEIMKSINSEDET